MAPETLTREAEDLAQRWAALQAWLIERFGRDADLSLESILFLIGVQASGQGFEPKLEKETKQALIMEGTYRALETLGFYEPIGMDENGRWLWETRVEPPQTLTVAEQEKLLRIAVLTYFDPILQETSTKTP